MSARIDSIYSFDYTNEIGFYVSVRDFTHLQMEYIAMAVSTEKVRVNSTPTRFKIDTEGSDNIREYAISRMGQLIEISKELAINSPQYILVCYADETTKYFKYDKEFCDIFTMAPLHKVTENNPTPKAENPYAIQKDVANDSVSCTNPAYTSTPTQPKVNPYKIPAAPKKKKKSIFAKILIAILILLGLEVAIALGAALFTENNDTSSTSASTYTTPALTPVSEPQSGTILSGFAVIGGSELTITASGGESCVVKLKNSSGATRLSFYVRAGDTVTVGVPAEYLYVYFASGDTWYGTSNLFGEHTSYSMDEEILDFTAYTWEYTLYPVTNGNFSETIIDASDF